MAEKRQTEIELDDQGRIVLNVPELVDTLREGGSQPAAPRRRASVNINCFGCPGDIDWPPPK
ncbi:hypothetical protein [Streptomyces fragilis]|uniref:Uncharacterized protein n=1 Tax=Streptomyces fragilis TaxID=67301 RepID=A0ABV2YJT3_9ACTN|nr:hypothetical protein [Streptomyces fragilis]